jgi:hypothetical protein
MQAPGTLIPWIVQLNRIVNIGVEMEVRALTSQLDACT